ncbi:MAG: ATP-binding cassette domain-containing protein [Muribaculaceae bacterium]|nr:ATP-binding cassette domain-containing protein [Muribaculaceae bacterium]
MESITLRQLLPDVFLEEQEEHRGSEIWLTEYTFRRGNRYVVHAGSGAGKSSMCAFIYGLRTDYRGEILFDGKPVRQLGAEQWSQLRTRSLAYVPQEMALFPELTVMDNIMLKNSMTSHLTEAEIHRLLQRAGIAQKASVRADRLSIGQQQRVAIIRALCQPLDFLLMDEPVSHLDPENNRLMASLIDEALTLNGAGLIVTSVGNPLLINPVTELKL